MISESLPGQFERLVETVIPISQQRGSFRREYEGATFRENLAITVLKNRYTRQKGERTVA